MTLEQRAKLDKVISDCDREIQALNRLEEELHRVLAGLRDERLAERRKALKELNLG